MGKKSSKTKTTTTPWAPAQPYLLGAASSIQNTVNQNAPQLQALQSQITGKLPDLWNMAMDQSTVQPSVNYANDVLGGKYLNSNPYLDSIVQRGEQDAANRVNSTFSQYGRTGSNDHAIDLARGTADAGNSLRYTDYANERGRMDNAAGLLPQIQASRFSGVTPALAGTQLAGQLPYYGVGALSGIGNLFGGYGTSTGKQPGGWGSDLLGAGVAALPFLFPSDRRLKTNIVRIGEWDDRGDGLGKYEWNWRSAPGGKRVVGVIADEVKELRPAAYVPNYFNGFDGVNYAKLGEAA
jgi:hypothetical protein